MWKENNIDIPYEFESNKKKMHLIVRADSLSRPEERSYTQQIEPKIQGGTMQRGSLGNKRE